MNYTEVDISNILKLARIQKPLKIKKVATLTGLSSQTIKNYEEGNFKKPKLKNLLLLCKAYDLDPYEIGITKVDCFKEMNHNTFFIATYFYEQQIVDEIKIEDSTLFVKRNEYVAQPVTKKDKLIHNLYKNRIWNRQIGLGFGIQKIISLDYYKKIIEQKCYYCGKENDQCESRNDLFYFHNGVDRLDSNKGYEKGNVVSCCSKCNMAKGTLSPEEFIQLAEDVSNYQRIKKTQGKA